MKKLNFKKTFNKMLSVSICAATLALGTQAFAESKEAQDFPKRTIKLVIGFPSGGATDVPFRVLAENLSKVLGKPVIVENKPGAGGVLPIVNIKSVKADGYTLVQTPVTVFRMPYITKTTVDPLEDLQYVINLAAYSFGLVVDSKLPIKTLQDYIDYAKENPGELTYSTPGAMTSLHLTMEAIAEEAGVEFAHVPYKGSADSLHAVLGGFTMSQAETPNWAPYVEEGKLRLLATWGDERSKQFPDTPTLQEEGIDIVQNSPFGLVVPKDTDPDIVKKLHDALKEAMEMDSYVEALDKFDMRPYYMSGEDYLEFGKKEMEAQTELLEKLGFEKK